jgi:hypothetical protein
MNMTMFLLFNFNIVSLGKNKTRSLILAMDVTPATEGGDVVVAASDMMGQRDGNENSPEEHEDDMDASSAKKKIFPCTFPGCDKVSL